MIVEHAYPGCPGAGHVKHVPARRVFVFSPAGKEDDWSVRPVLSVLALLSAVLTLGLLSLADVKLYQQRA